MYRKFLGPVHCSRTIPSRLFHYYLDDLDILFCNTKAKVIQLVSFQLGCLQLLGALTKTNCTHLYILRIFVFL